ncbi:chemotaxis protein MotB [Bradymonadaceae bacterium TMQ3]|uniref:Chemotaxis protein MotB n=1 Tax=Lujinxingia sediminis TaxID=2480984 RepID=A0ABY0CQE1_9DELT|nr:OmpA family protein [Lujinxingia sediminis]RDV37951.1 chemotaxis protein MotB [Bradymonadaceae bacterium TMQ3]RVU42721.1 chemotaxis protein MotB [Lujinxingia sediminis]TXC75271.1 OmpA family protein [Bradymonadales bacterium TMQ1]
MQKTFIALIAASLLVGCGVPKDEHEAMLRDMENTKVALATTEREKAEVEEELRGQIETLEARIARLENDKLALETELSEARGDLDLYESRAGGLEEALEASRTELDELRRARAQTEERLKEYRNLASRLASMVESGQLTVKIREGRMVIELADNILFDSGRTDIKDDGRLALQELAAVLQEVDDRNFLVAGHTDNVPISSGRFSSNWELSTARAVEVVKFLQEQGVDPTNLAAAGYGEFDPVADNEDRDARALNRRIEIILMPNIEELPSVPDDVFEGS